MMRKRSGLGREEDMIMIEYKVTIGNNAAAGLGQLEFEGLSHGDKKVRLQALLRWAVAERRERAFSEALTALIAIENAEVEAEVDRHNDTVKLRREQGVPDPGQYLYPQANDYLTREKVLPLLVEAYLLILEGKMTSCREEILKQVSRIWRGEEHDGPSRKAFEFLIVVYQPLDSNFFGRDKVSFMAWRLRGRRSNLGEQKTIENGMRSVYVEQRDILFWLGIPGLPEVLAKNLAHRWINSLERTELLALRFASPVLGMLKKTVGPNSLGAMLAVQFVEQSQRPIEVHQALERVADRCRFVDTEVGGKMNDPEYRPSRAEVVWQDLKTARVEIQFPSDFPKKRRGEPFRSAQIEAEKLQKQHPDFRLSVVLFDDQ